MEASIKKFFDSLSHHREVLAIKDMIENKEYTLSNLERINTKYGERIRCVLDGEFNLYLPPKFLIMTQEQMDFLNLEQHKLVKRATKGGSTYITVVKKKLPKHYYDMFANGSDEE